MTEQVRKWMCALIATVAIAYSGSGFTKNYALAKLPEIIQAAESGNANAQYALALRHETGEGVSRSYQTARQWYQAAAEQGHTKALYEMGMLYAMGRFTQDTEIAISESKKWFNRLSGGHTVVDHNFYIGRDNIERKFRLKSGSISDMADRIVWLRKTSPRGHIEAQRYLGYLYDYGKNVTQSCVEAANWYEKAAIQGDAMSQSRMGDLWVVCKGIPVDYQKSVNWHRKAATQGNVTSQITLSGYYKLGKYGIPVNHKESAYWIAQAAEQGNAVAQKSLGDLYKDGLGVPRNLVIARDWYKKAAAQGYDRGQQALADISRGAGQESKQALAAKSLTSSCQGVPVTLMEQQNNWASKYFAELPANTSQSIKIKSMYEISQLAGVVANTAIGGSNKTNLRSRYA